MSIIFGPVPSRRLGKSLGVNNIPPKFCTYSCVYCQVGPTKNYLVARREFYSCKKIFNALKYTINELNNRDEKIDYISFVPDGEPTLDINIGKEIYLLKQFNIKIALITNGSLLWEKNLQDELLILDYISVKIDAISETVWHRINRPHKGLEFSMVKEGVYEFRNKFKNKFVTETMLVKLNDSEEELNRIAKFLTKLSPDIAYIGVPVRPPTEVWAIPPNEGRIYLAYEIFKSHGLNTELLIGYEGSEFGATGDAEKDLLSITSVHPMREKEVRNLLRKDDSDWSVVKNLIRKGELVELNYQGESFFLRRLRNV